MYVNLLLTSTIQKAYCEEGVSLTVQLLETLLYVKKKLRMVWFLQYIEQTLLDFRVDVLVAMYLYGKIFSYLISTLNSR